MLVVVRDSGRRLTELALSHLSYPFHTTKPGGLGIGLSICRSIIAAHGERLWASANAPRGAIFQFTVPLVEADGTGASSSWGLYAGRLIRCAAA